jgi:hypothetical protein
MRCAPSEIHTYEAYANEVHTHEMWLTGITQTRLTSLNSIPLLVNISTLLQTGIPVLPMHFSLLSSRYV